MNPIYTAFVYLVWFLATYYIVFLALLLFTNKERLYEKKGHINKKKPFISLIIPAFNEEGKIAKTITSLKKINYKKIEFILINDGSSDKTNEVISKNIEGFNKFIFINHKKNKGKAMRLNEGIDKSKGSFIACMDADSIIGPGIFNKVLPYFKDKDIGAVTVSVEVIKPKTFLHKIIELEYIIGLSLFLKLFSMFNCVFVTPGPFSIYRKSLLKEIGGFDPENITEDLEIAYRIHKSKYKIANCMGAKVRTIIPQTFKEIYVQRRRWYSGAIQTLFKHRKMALNKNFDLFGYFIPYNYLLIFLGLSLFLTSTYLGISNFIENLLYFQYTNFNFLERAFEFEFDILRTGMIYLIGCSSLFIGMFVMISGLKFTNKEISKKKLGVVGYPLLFILYQIFWIGSILTVMRGKKIKWK